MEHLAEDLQLMVREGALTLEEAHGMCPEPAAAASPSPPTATAPVTGGQGRSQSELAIDGHVTIHGLKGAPQHNGKHGTLVGFDAERGRWVVALPHLQLKLKIKAENLTPTNEAHSAKGHNQSCFNTQHREVKRNPKNTTIGTEEADTGLASEPQPVTQSLPLSVGSAVTINGLRGAPQHNGKLGKLVAFVAARIRLG